MSELTPSGCFYYGMLTRHGQVLNSNTTTNSVLSISFLPSSLVYTHPQTEAAPDTRSPTAMDLSTLSTSLPPGLADAEREMGDKFKGMYAMAEWVARATGARWTARGEEGGGGGGLVEGRVMGVVGDALARQIDDPNTDSAAAAMSITHLYKSSLGYTKVGGGKNMTVSQWDMGGTEVVKRAAKTSTGSNAELGHLALGIRALSEEALEARDSRPGGGAAMRTCKGQGEARVSDRTQCVPTPGRQGRGSDIAPPHRHIATSLLTTTHLLSGRLHTWTD